MTDAVAVALTLGVDEATGVGDNVGVNGGIVGVTLAIAVCDGALVGCVTLWVGVREAGTRVEVLVARGEGLGGGGE